MSQKPVIPKAEAGKVVKDIRRAIRKIHCAEEKIRIVLAGLRGEEGAMTEDQIQTISARHRLSMEQARELSRLVGYSLDVDTKDQPCHDQSRYSGEPSAQPQTRQAQSR